MPLAPFTKMQIAASRSTKAHLAAGEYRAAGDTILVMASLAFELAARGQVVGFTAAATRANRAFRPKALFHKGVSRLLVMEVFLRQD